MSALQRTTVVATYNYKHGALTTMLREPYFNSNCLSCNIDPLPAFCCGENRISRSSLPAYNHPTGEQTLGYATKFRPGTTVEHRVQI